MSKLFRNDSPGAMTREEAVEFIKKRMAERRRQAQELAEQGRGDDTEIAHVALGELVIPKILQTPELLDALRRAAAAQNMPFEKLRVGSRRNSINPNTGAPEFSSGDPVYDYFFEGIQPGGDAPYPYEGMDVITTPWVDPNQQWVDTQNYQNGFTNPQQSEGGGGAEIDGINVIGKPWPSGTQAMAWPTVNKNIIGGTDFRAGDRSYGPHNGVDLRSYRDQPISSVVDGEVVEVNTDNDPKKGGNYILVRDANGNLYGYAHTGGVDGLKVGQKVEAGQQIGHTDGSGNADPHLHFTYRPGTPQAPATIASPKADPNLIFQGLGGLVNAKR